MCPRGEGARTAQSKASRGSITRLGLDGLDVGVGAVRRGRLVLGLLVLHGVDDLVVGRRDGRARDGADDEDPARIYDVGVGALIWPRNALTRRVSDAGANPSMRL